MEDIVKICGLEKEEIISRLEKFFDKGITFKLDVDALDAKLTISSLSLTPMEFEIIKSNIYNQFEDEVYATGDIKLNVLAAKLLKHNGRVLGVAESLTGGEVCSKLCEVPGISENLYEGIVCYNSKSKVQRLGVSTDTLINYGAVSSQTAREMIQGIVKLPIDIGVATTGLAGPTGEGEKPVGLVYIAVGCGDFIPVFEKHFIGDRNEIRNKATNMALFYLIRYLKGDILRI